MILSLDKITRLLFSYAKTRLKSSAALAIASRETAILSGVKEEAESFQQEFEAGFVPSCNETRPAVETAENIAPQLLEAENTFQDLADADAEPGETSLRKRQPGVSPLFLSQTLLAIRSTCNSLLKSRWRECPATCSTPQATTTGLAPVFYTPLIIALASTGATIHKGFLRIVGCMIGGALGLICSIWVIPRFETLATFLFIVFCVHGLAAWIAVGSDRISYVGLQIAMAFDLGFLQGYGPPENIDPLRDQFIGIVIGICIATTIFALIWPESADLSAP